MVYLLDGKRINNTQFVHNGVSYPSNWCELASPSELDSLGIVSLKEVWPKLGENEYYTGEYVDDTIALTRTYSVGVLG